ncbi:hypothetical protein [Amaricoccus tamworthensis]|uniref:hypothetical protein n=1 Tax=Amaricoccus tamworthensis TaxID=57002 RepID=UPI003C7AACAE
MGLQTWTEILSRITSQDAEDLEDLIAERFPRSEAVGGDVFPEPVAVLRRETQMRDPATVCVGLRVLEQMPDVADRAMRLASFALERQVEIVILSHCDRSGFERFGFRVELVKGDTEAARAACEEQICRMWNIDLVL